MKLPFGKLRGLIFAVLNDGLVSYIFGCLLPIPVKSGSFHIFLPENSPRTLRTRLFFNIYERPEITLIEKWLPADIHCVELGGSIGVVSLHALKKLNFDIPLISAEAFHHLAEVARKNIRFNYPTRTNAIVDEGCIFYDGDKAVMLGGSSNTEGQLNTESSAGIEVPATRLRDILKEHNIANYSLIYDIEGAEFAILKNDQDALKACKIVIVEVHGGTVGFKNTMADLGFKLVDRKHSTYVFSKE